jgi:hypothetical protein
MKKLMGLFLPALIALMCVVVFAQAPAGGGQGGGQRGGGGGGRGGRGGFPPAPPATGPVADATNKIVEAINKQDAAFFDKALTADAILADEDGHVGLPARVWVMRLTTTPKKLAITGLRVGDLGTEGAWAVFNYTLDEMTAQGASNQMQGTSTIVYKKNGADLQAVLIQLSVNGRAITPH